MKGVSRTAIRLNYYPEWVKLLETKLTPATPLATEQVQDDDPNPYRQDERMDFNYIGWPKETHIAKMFLRSDDERYKCKLVLIELDPDTDKIVEKRIIFQREIIPGQDRTIKTEIDGVLYRFVIGAYK